MPFSEVKLIDIDGSPLLKACQRGEICVRDETVTSGYWQRPEATSQALTADGWLRTRDLSYFDADGYLYVIDRLKDMIISGGKNIYPGHLRLGSDLTHAVTATRTPRRHCHSTLPSSWWILSI